MRDVKGAGGGGRGPSFRPADDIAALPETIVFNCTGWVRASCYDDTDLRPARGQLVRDACRSPRWTMPSPAGRANSSRPEMHVLGAPSSSTIGRRRPIRRPPSAAFVRTVRCSPASAVVMRGLGFAPNALHCVRYALICVRIASSAVGDAIGKAFARDARSFRITQLSDRGGASGTPDARA